MQVPVQNLCLAHVTCSDKDEAHKIAQAVVDSKSAACVNILGNIQSVYRWKDQIEISDEYLLIIKTCREAIPKLKEIVLNNHSYECPEFIVSDIAGGDEKYLKWWRDNLGEL